MEKINHIVIHCAATPNGKALGHFGKTAAEIIDEWHAERGFHRTEMAKRHKNPHLNAIGYHFVIETNGCTESGRTEWEQGAHVKGHNENSLGICLVGTDQFTRHQWHALARLLDKLKNKYPNAQIVGHRDFPNVHKTCPGFSVKDYFLDQEKTVSNHLCD